MLSIVFVVVMLAVVGVAWPHLCSDCRDVQSMRAGMTSEVSTAAIMEGSMEVAGIIELGCLGTGLFGLHSLCA